MSAERAYPLVLAQLAACLSGHEVIGVDLQRDPVVAARTPRVDLVVASVLPHNARSLRAIMAEHRAAGARTVVVGLLPTLDPARALRESGAEYAVQGDPEHTVQQLAQSAHPNALPAVASLSTPARQPGRVPLGSLPLMDRRTFPPRAYTGALRSTRTPYAMVITSRGCLRSCGFCPRPVRMEGRFDARPAHQVVTELLELHATHGMRAAHIEDDAFLADRERALAVCAGLEAAGAPLALELVNGVRVDDLDAPLAAALGRAGCTRVVLSLEHLADERTCTLATPVDRAQEAVGWLRSEGIRVGGYFTVGLPGTTRRGAWQSTTRALALGLDDANWIPYKPRLGSPWASRPPALSSMAARGLTLAATAAFFAGPQGEVLRTELEQEGVSSSLRDKAVELAVLGGPPRDREMP